MTILWKKLEKYARENISEKSLLIIALLIGFLMRIFHLYNFAKSPLFKPVSLDEIYHHLWAIDISKGGFFPDGAFFRAPLYSYLLGFFYWISDGNLLVARLIGIICGILSIYLGWKLVRHFSDNKWTSFAVACIFALNPVLIYFESRLLLDFMLVPLTLAFLLLLIKNKGNFIWAGIIGGLFAINRPTILALLPFICVWILYRTKKFKAIIIFTIGILIPILPVFVSNLYNDSFALVATQGGVNFYIGNNPDADGVSANFPGLGYSWHYTDVVRLVKAENPKVQDISKYFYLKTLKFLWNKPLDASRLLLKKTVLLLHGVFVGNNGDISFYREYSPLLRLPTFSGLLFALGLSGLIILRKKDFQLLGIFFFIYSIIIIAFFVNTRFKLPLYPIMIISGVLLVENRIIRFRENWRLILKSIPIIALIIFLSIDFFGFSQHNQGDFYFALGLSEINQDPKEASNYFKKSLEINPKKKSANLNLGIIDFKNKDYENAERHFLSEIDNRGDVAKAYSNLGLVKRLQGEHSKALRYGKLALLQQGDLRDAYYNLAQSFRQINLPDSSLKYAKQGLSNYPDNLRLLSSVASAFYTMGSDSAFVFFKKIIQKGNKDFIENYDFGSRLQSEMGFSHNDRQLIALAHFNLTNSKIPTDSLQYHLEKAIELNPAFQDAYIQLGNVKMMTNKKQEAQALYEKAIEIGPTSPLLAFNYGNLLASSGKYSDALKFFEIAVSDPTISVEAQKRITAIEKILN